MAAASGSAGAGAHGAQLRSARLEKIHGHVYLVLRVNSSSKWATVRIIERNKLGQKVRTITARVRTNQTVKLAIALAKNARSVGTNLD